MRAHNRREIKHRQDLYRMGLFLQDVQQDARQRLNIKRKYQLGSKRFGSVR
jgi:hypothetical protein